MKRKQDDDESRARLTAYLESENYFPAVGMMRDAIGHMEHRIGFLEEKEKKWKEISAEMERCIEKVKSRVILNVGGSRFETTKEVLLRQPDTYFSAMLSTEKWQVMIPSSNHIEIINLRFITT
jgi:hypothetical protein